MPNATAPASIVAVAPTATSPAPAAATNSPPAAANHGFTAPSSSFPAASVPIADPAAYAATASVAYNEPPARPPCVPTYTKPSTMPLPSTEYIPQMSWSRRSTRSEIISRSPERIDAVSPPGSALTPGVNLVLITARPATDTRKLAASITSAGPVPKATASSPPAGGPTTQATDSRLSCQAYALARAFSGTSMGTALPDAPLNREDSAASGRMTA